MDIDFNKQYKSLIFLMRLNHCYPHMAKGLKWCLGFTIRHFFYTIAFVLLLYNIIRHDLKVNDFSQVCKNGVLSVMYIVTTSLFTVTIYHEKILQGIINTMIEDYSSSKRLSEQDQKIVLTYAKKGKWIINQWFLVSFGGCGVFMVKSVVLTIYFGMKTGVFKPVEYYVLKYPDFIEESEHQTIVFLFKYGVMLYFSLYGAGMYAACSPLGPLFMLHACGQLELLKNRIDVLYDGRTIEQVKDELTAITKKIQFIYGFIDDVKTCFRACYEMTMKGTAIMLPITCYELIESIKRGELTMEFVAFMIGSLLFSSAPCYYSDMLMEKGEDVRMALYMCGWEREYDRGVRSSLAIMLLRAMRPSAIRTMFRTVCLEALTDLFQQSYGIFNLMTAMWN